MVLWIHGGGFREGWGSEPEVDGQEWGAKDVVLVSINYRLGVFGFLVHPALSAESPHHVSGNYGILDQIEALKWIKKNIAQFGGDPNGPKGGKWAPCTEKNPNFMVFKLDDKDAEASFFGTPERAPQPQGFGFPPTR